MATVTKDKLREELCFALGFSKQKAAVLVDLLFDTMSEILADGEGLRISRFGNFILHDKTARPGRNPRTGEYKEVSARRVVTFKAGNKLRGKMADFAGPETDDSH